MLVCPETAPEHPENGEERSQAGSTVIQLRENKENLDGSKFVDKALAKPLFSSTPGGGCSPCSQEGGQEESREAADMQGGTGRMRPNIRGSLHKCQSIGISEVPREIGKKR